MSCSPWHSCVPSAIELSRSVPCHKASAGAYRFQQFRVAFMVILSWAWEQWELRTSASLGCRFLSDNSLYTHRQGTPRLFTAVCSSAALDLKIRDPQAWPQLRTDLEGALWCCGGPRLKSQQHMLSCPMASVPASTFTATASWDWRRPTEWMLPFV